MIKLTIIGAGKIAEKFYLPAVKKIKDASVVGVIDQDISKAKILSKKFNVQFFSKDLRSLMNKTDLDAALICSSNYSHDDLILNSLKNNLHVICEKPFLLRLKNIEKIKKLIKKKKLICLSAQHQRYRACSLKLKKILEMKKLGKIYSIHINSKYSYSHALKNKNFIKKSLSGGGPLLDLGSHFLDLVYWFLDSPQVKSVNSFNSNIFANNLKKKNKLRNDFNIEDYSSGMIRLKKGPIISYEFSYSYNSNIKKIENITIMGTNYNLTWPDLILSKINTKIKKLKGKNSKKASIIMIDKFIKDIKSKKINIKDLSPTFNSLKTINLLYKSAQKKKEVIFENY